MASKLAHLERTQGTSIPMESGSAIEKLQAVIFAMMLEVTYKSSPLRIFRQQRCETSALPSVVQWSVIAAQRPIRGCMVVAVHG
jgi:hypothetical protein